MDNYFIKRAHNAGLIMLICMLILCGIYAVYAYHANAGNSQQAHTTQHGLLVMAHHVQVPTSAPIQASKPVQQAAPLPQQPVLPSSVYNKSDWQNYFRRLYHLP